MRWELEEYARILQAEGREWYAAVILCGEAGLRIGEVRALRWREDVDMVACTVTVRSLTGSMKSLFAAARGLGKVTFEKMS